MVEEVIHKKDEYAAIYLQGAMIVVYDALHLLCTHNIVRVRASARAIE